MPPDTKPTLRQRSFELLGQMDWFRGLRAAVALCAPLVLGDVAGIPNLGWAALGGFEAIVADAGGPYRSRLGSLATLTLGGAAGLFLGSLTGTTLHFALPITIVWCFVWTYLAVLGQPFTSAGVLVQVIYICGIGAPTSSIDEAFSRSLLLVAGGAWAALLSLLLWPLDAYRPARAAVSACYTELASFLNSVADLSKKDRQSPALWHRLAQHHQFRIRRAVEQGWEAVAAVRAENTADSPQGNQLVVLLEHADLLIARTIALADHLESQAKADTPCHARTLTGLAELQAAERWIAELLIRRNRASKAEAKAKQLQMTQLPDSLRSCMGEPDPGERFLLDQLTESASILDSSIESLAQLRLGGLTGRFSGGKPVKGIASVGHFAYVYERLGQLRQGWRLRRIADQLRANFTAKSLSLRHAARVALVCGLDVALIFTAHIDHGYWLLMTSLVVMQPHVSGTMRRGLQRVGGTIGGGILAAFLAVALHSQLATAAALFPLALLALAILPVNYTAFAFFLTPTFVLAWLPWSGDWQLALVRTVNTIIGAALAVAAMHFLFPSYESDRAPEFLRASIAANRRYLALLSGAWRSRSGTSRALAQARRAAGLAHNDTEESLDRLMAESWPRRRPFAQFVVAFITYLRRFAQSITTLAALDGEWEWKQSTIIQNRLELLNRRMEWLEAQLTAAQAETAQFSTAPWPERGETPPVAKFPAQDHPGERLFERLERQTAILRRQLVTLRQQGWIPGAAPE